MKYMTHNDMIKELNEIYTEAKYDSKHHEKDLHDSRVAHVAYDSRLEELYNEQPTFEEALDELWDGQLEYDTEE